MIGPTLLKKIAFLAIFGGPLMTAPFRRHDDSIFTPQQGYVCGNEAECVVACCIPVVASCCGYCAAGCDDLVFYCATSCWVGAEGCCC